MLPAPLPGRTCRPRRGRPTTAKKDVSLTIPTMRRCSLAVFRMQACAFSTFAIQRMRKRSRTGSHRLSGRRSVPHQGAGHRASIEPWRRFPVGRAGSTATAKTTGTATGPSWSSGPSVMATAFRSCASRKASGSKTRISSRTRASKQIGRAFRIEEKTMSTSERLPGSREEDAWLSDEQLDRCAPAEAEPFQAPVPTRMVSNGEYMPHPQTNKQRHVEARVKEIADSAAKKLGITRRQFLEGAGGMAASFLAMNEVYGANFKVSQAELFEPGAAEENGPPRNLFVLDDQTHIVRSSRNTPQ